MRHSQVLNRLQRLLAHSSPSKKEYDLSQEIISQLQELDLKISTHKLNNKYAGNCGNILAVLEAVDDSKRTITFNAHMDTVETDKPPRYEIENGKIYSTGEYAIGLDDKAGIAAIIQAIAEIKEKQIPCGRINLLFTVSEEIGLIGAKNFDASLIKDSFVYVMDSHGAPGTIINRAPTQISLDALITGKPAHSGVEPEKGISAIIAASRAIWNMKLGRIDELTTANVGTINGGIARNIVPDSAKIKAEARSHDDKKLKDQIDHMIGAFEESCRHQSCRFSYEIVEEYKSYCLEEDEEIVKLAIGAINKSGIRPSIESTGGGSDTNIFNDSGVPALALSCGYYNPHTPDEYANIDELDKSVEILVNLARQ